VTTRRAAPRVGGTVEFKDLLSIIAKDDRREDFAELAHQLHALRSTDPDERSASTNAERQALLAELQHQLRLHLRAARHPIPSDEELEGMVARYFGSGT
jgi:hypothetical protein